MNEHSSNVYCRTHNIEKTTFIVSSYFNETSTQTSEELIMKLLMSKVAAIKGA